ncbi:MAG: twin-arginine translocase TatA/TatE family subunit [Actinobacteria bacterium]|nr:MAG: twin-arginine translocase TatA/TatE family subunit [Actinomycetota bacterium]
MFNIGPLELIVILVIALLVVGPRRLPEVGRSIGRGIREFRKAQEEVQKTIQSALNEEPASTARSAPTPDGATPPEGQAVADGGEGTELVRHVGKGLAELRKAKDEIQRSLRVDLDDEGDGGRSTAE